MKKQIFGLFLVLGLAAMMVGVGVNAATTADVAATVTAQLVSVTVSTGSVAYGTMELSASSTTALNDGDSLDNTQTATNNGNVDVDLGIRSSDAAGGTPWELAASAGSNEFTHEFCTATCDSTPVWNAFNVDNNIYSTLANTVSASGTQDFDLKIGTPTFSTDSVEHTVTVTVQATAS